jgi:hypothetical protein
MVCHIEKELGYGTIFYEWEPQPLCKKDCNSMQGNRHKETAQRAPSGKKIQNELYRIPERLINEIFDAIELQ